LHIGKKLDPDLPDPLKTTKNQPTLVVAHKICMPSLNAADIGRRKNPACMQKLCRGRLHKVTSGVKLLLFLGVVVYLSRTTAHVISKVVMEEDIYYSIA